jgi:hypothetical protein
MSEEQQKMFDAASASVRAHLTVYGFRVNKEMRPYAQIVITDGKGNQLILRAVN